MVRRQSKKSMDRWCKISLKKESATRPPQNPQFSTSGRLWMATWTERASKRGSFWGGREHQKSKKAVPKGGQSAVENRLLKTDRVFLQMGAKMYSQSNIIRTKSFRKRSLEMSWMEQTRGSNKHMLWLGDGAKSQYIYVYTVSYTHLTLPTILLV